MSGYCEKWDTYYDDTGKWAEPECECDPDECDYRPRPENHPPFCPKCPSEKGRADGLIVAIYGNKPDD